MKSPENKSLKTDGGAQGHSLVEEINKKPTGYWLRTTTVTIIEDGLEIIYDDNNRIEIGMNADMTPDL